MPYVRANTESRIIEFIEAPVSGFQSVDVRVDIYSYLKSEWHANNTLQKLKFPFRSFGDPTGESQIGPYIFIDNVSGWRMLPYAADHELILRGNLIPESAVQGLTVPLWLSQSNNTVIIKMRESAQALTVTTGGADANGIANAVWNKATSGMNTAGSVGEHITTKTLTKSQYMSLKE